MNKFTTFISSESYTLNSILNDYGYKVGSYQIYVKDKKVLNPQVLIKLIEVISYQDEIEKVDFNMWTAWQDLLRQATYKNQQGKSLLTGQSLNVKSMQLHHALITKGMIRGKKGLDRNLIHHTYNVMLLNRDEHINSQVGADNRELCAKKLIELYGKGSVKLWYFSYPMKSKLPNIFE